MGKTTRSATLDTQRNGLKWIMQFFFANQRHQWWKGAQHCHRPGYCLINSNDRIIEQVPMLRRYCIEEKVRDDLNKFLRHGIFAVVGQTHEKVKVTPLARGLGDRFVLLVAYLKDNNVAFTERQCHLKARPNKKSVLSEQHMRLYETAMNDKAWLKDVLRPHLNKRRTAEQIKAEFEGGPCYEEPENVETRVASSSRSRSSSPCSSSSSSSSSCSLICSAESVVSES